MGIQINGSTDTISAVDGSLSIEGGELRTVSGINVAGVVTATSYQGDGSALTGIAATDNVRTGILDVAGVGTFRSDVNVPDSIIHLGDTDTKIRFPAADTVTFETGGSERARIDSSGRLLVGTNTTTLGHPIQVVGDSNANAIAIIGRPSDDIGEFSFYENDQTTILGELQYRQDHLNLRHRVGDIRFATAGTTERMRIDSEGVVRAGNNLTAARRDANGIGMKLSTNWPNTPLEIEAEASGTRYMITFYQGSTPQGRIETASGSTSYVTSSDYRLKENIVPVTDGIERLLQLKPNRFNFIAHPSKTVDGFLAHEVQGVVPEAISGEKDAFEVWQEGEELPDGVSVGDNKLDEDGNTIPKYQGIDQSKLVPLLTAALQEAIGKIETLEAANASQAATIAALDSRLTALEGA